MGEGCTLNNAGVRLARIERGDCVNGFGRLGFTLWFQGCSLRCEGCHNPELWRADGGEEYSYWDIRTQIERELHWLSRGGAIIFLGGEPTDQLAGLGMVKGIADWHGIPTILYTGRSEEELEKMGVKLTDFGIVKAGRFIEGQKGLKLASDNQRIYRGGVLSAYLS